MFKCYVCDAVLQDSQSLQSHNRRFHMNRRYRMFCGMCNKRFHSNIELESHIREIHLAVMVKCDVCNTVLQDTKGLQKHSRRFHKTSSVLPTPKMLCGTCRERFHSNLKLESHIHEQHNVQLVREKLFFNNENEFNNWRCSVESEYKGKYIRSRCIKKPDKSVVYYTCNRSGKPRHSVSDENGKWGLKRQGSLKIGSHCPSRIITTHYVSGSVTVDFYKTHHGHTLELIHLPIPSPKENELSAEILFDAGHEATEQLDDEEAVVLDVESPQLCITAQQNPETGALSYSPCRNENDNLSDLESDKMRTVEYFLSILNDIKTDGGLKALNKALKKAVPVVAAENLRSGVR